MSEFRIYKPRKDSNGKFVGAASKVQVVKKKNRDGYDEVMVFWTSANQTGEDEKGNSRFDWKSDKNPESKQVVMLLGDPDIGEILCVLNGVKNKVGQPSGKGLFHQTNDTASSSFSLEKRQNSDPSKYDDGYIMRISSKRNNELVAVSHSLSLGEGEILRVMLSNAIIEKYGVS